MAQPLPTAADLYLKSLKANGVDYVFANAGTDFAPIVESILTSGHTQDIPAFIICPHENLAVSMAQGFYLATGRPQAAMVHVNVGVANAMCALLNAARDNVPVLFASGRTPVTEHGRLGSRDNFIHWGQEMYDQAAMLREFVKWDYELRYPEQAQSMVNRAHAIAMSEPRGPVYMSLPREVLAAPVNLGNISAAPSSPATAAHADPESIANAARMLAGAKAPLIITSRAGRTARGVAALSKLAGDYAIPVVEFAANYMCLATNHPMHAGFSPAPLLKDADLVIVADAPVPWPPTRINPSHDCPVIHIGSDPLYQQLPFRGYRSDLTIGADVAIGLEQLAGAMEVNDDVDRKAIDARRAKLEPELAAARAKRVSKASKPGAAITHDYASYCLNQALGEDAILVNERGCLREAMSFSKAGTFFGPTIAGGLGASIGVALGIKIADPSRTVAAALGDGSCIFNNPVACLQTAVAQDLPILIAVLNNEAWHSVKSSTLQVYPDGATSKSNAAPLTSLAPSPDYAGVARACGADGVRVKDPADLPGAIADALKKVQEDRKTVLLDIAIEQA